MWTIELCRRLIKHIAQPRGLFLLMEIFLSAEFRSNSNQTHLNLLINVLKIADRCMRVVTELNSKHIFQTYKMKWCILICFLLHLLVMEKYKLLSMLKDSTPVLRHNNSQNHHDPHVTHYRTFCQINLACNWLIYHFYIRAYCTPSRQLKHTILNVL